LDAIAAIEKYQPDTVVASWVTHWIDPNLPVPPHGGNIYGVMPFIRSRSAYPNLDRIYVWND
jgi:hypothetical protein